MAACETGQAQAVYDHFRRAFALDPAYALRAIVGEFGGRFTTIVRALGKSDELADWISERTAEQAGINLISPLPAPEARLAVQKSRQTALERGLPSALLVTQSESAGTGVGGIFSRSIFRTCSIR